MAVQWRDRLAGSRLARAVYFDIAVPFARWLPLPSKLIGPVKGVHPSTGAWVGDHSERGRLDWIEDAHDVDYAPPAVAFPGVPPNFARHATVRAPAQFVAHINEGRVATRFFEPVAPDDRVFLDLLAGAEDAYAQSTALRTLWLPRLQRRSGRHVLVMTRRASNYYHWVNDCLSRLKAVECVDVPWKGIIVPRKLSRFQHESLELLGIGVDDRQPFGDEYWVADELVLPSLATAPQHTSRDASRWLRERLHRAVGATSGSGRRIYVSRARATKRQLVNEDEIVQYLGEKGFCSVETETMSFAEQVALLRGADVVVGAHGAGLTNAMFMQEGATLLELVPSRRGKPCFYSLAQASGLRYGCVTDADSSGEASAVDGRDADFLVPLERVAEGVQWACQ